jgi:hypothetical protein
MGRQKITSAAITKPTTASSPFAEAAAEPSQQIIEVLQQVMYTHDAEKLAISVLEIYEDRMCEERSSK